MASSENGSNDQPMTVQTLMRLLETCNPEALVYFQDQYGHGRGGGSGRGYPATGFLYAGEWITITNESRG